MNNSSLKGISVMKEKSVKKYKQFVEEFLTNECEGDIVEITVHTGYHTESFWDSHKEGFSAGTLKAVAYIKNNDVVQDKIRFIYYLDNKKSPKYLPIKDFTTYVIKCKKIKNKDLYYLIKIKKIKDKRFDSITNQLQLQKEITAENVLFVFDRKEMKYKGSLMFNNKKINVFLALDVFSNMDFTKSINAFKKINSNFQQFYSTVIKRCYDTLITLAKEWNEHQEDYQDITASEFENRITKQEIEMKIDRKGNFELYFEDDEIFGDHVIVYDGEIDSDSFRVNIEG